MATNRKVVRNKDSRTKKMASNVRKKTVKTNKGRKEKLTARQEAFCQLYVSADFLGNGVQAYIHAYSVDLTRQGAYNGAKASASQLLTNPNVLKRIDEVMDDAVLNDQFVDKRLAFLIQQVDDKHVTLGAIKEYNKLKKRIEEKINITSNFNVRIS